jgi:hypothetical protein
MGYAKPFLYVYQEGTKQVRHTTSVVIAEKNKGIYHELTTVMIRNKGIVREAMEFFHLKKIPYFTKEIPIIHPILY